MCRMINRIRLRKVLKQIYDIDPSRSSNKLCVNDAEREQLYYKRNTLVKKAVYLARESGYKAGYVLHTPFEDIISGIWEPEWSIVALIELPTGQITWHMDSRGLQYDGHSDSQKWERVSVFLGGE